MPLTKIQKRFVELDKHKETIKLFYVEYEQAVLAVAQELAESKKRKVPVAAVGMTFVGDEGEVYEVIRPKGHWVKYETIAITHTKRPQVLALNPTDVKRATDKERRLKKKKVVKK